MLDVYIAIDFSGSKHRYLQRKSIYYAEKEHGSKTEATNRRTRQETVDYLFQRLKALNAEGKRALFGFDFQYSFPKGFWGTLTGRSDAWENVLKGLAEGVDDLPAIVEEPVSNARDWAAKANEALAKRVGLENGPFWGANFVQQKDPRFPYYETPFGEKRATDLLRKDLKPIFKIGGAGSVGLQSLCGMPLLHQFLQRCRSDDIPVHCWPFDGWNIGTSRHVLVEWCPKIQNVGKKSDKNDAVACVDWAYQQDVSGSLES